MSKTLGSLPIGALIKDVETTFLGVPIVWKKADSNHADYPVNSTTLITEKIIARKASDAKEPNNTNSGRKSYGNNKYSVSNIDQWLNSEAAAGQWYTARHEADQAPDSMSVVSSNPYSSIAGFLNGFSDGFKKALLDTTLKVALNKVTDGDIIVADKNFGCGSSREHAPIAIKAAGVSCVIAETFARIFYRNAINIGLPIIECPEAAKGIEDGDQVEVDFDSGKIYNKTKGTEFQGQAFPEFMQNIISNGGLINHINNSK